MSVKLSKSEYDQLVGKFYYLVNYESSDPDTPIDPLTYIDSNGDNCLHIAAQLGDIETVQMLLKGGIDVNSKGDMGYTALRYAKTKGFEKLMELLILNGADPAR
ncbi:MAG: ankyrin repeat domain-containing protein [Cytophagales bacterium]|nr:ankyrin repeat domain-containing protein [Cytophagales bacterium]